MNWSIGTGNQILRGPYEEASDHTRRMQAAYERLALCNYFILVGSRIATEKQRAAEPQIRKKLLQLARFG